MSNSSLPPYPIKIDDIQRYLIDCNKILFSAKVYLRTGNTIENTGTDPVIMAKRIIELTQITRGNKIHEAGLIMEASGKESAIIPAEVLCYYPLSRTIKDIASLYPLLKNISEENWSSVSLEDIDFSQRLLLDIFSSFDKTFTSLNDPETYRREMLKCSSINHGFIEADIGLSYYPSRISLIKETQI
jgi:hypothetical protein